MHHKSTNLDNDILSKLKNFYTELSAKNSDFANNMDSVNYFIDNVVDHKSLDSIYWMLCALNETGLLLPQYVDAILQNPSPQKLKDIIYNLKENNLLKENIKLLFDLLTEDHILKAKTLNDFLLNKELDDLGKEDLEKYLLYSHLHKGPPNDRASVDNQDDNPSIFPKNAIAFSSHVPSIRQLFETAGGLPLGLPRAVRQGSTGWRSASRPAATWSVTRSPRRTSGSGRPSPGSTRSTTATSSATGTS